MFRQLKEIEMMGEREKTYGARARRRDAIDSHNSYIPYTFYETKYYYKRITHIGETYKSVFFFASCVQNVRNKTNQHKKIYGKANNIKDMPEPIKWSARARDVAIRVYNTLHSSNKYK